MTTPSPRVQALLAKTQHNRGRLIFALDATASREPTWDMAAQLQASMFEEAAKIGGLNIQLAYYRGHNEVHHTPWTSDAHELIGRMSAIRCMAGATQIVGMLHHIHSQTWHEKIAAAVFIGDACEERPQLLYDIAASLSVPLFMFQEGDNPVMTASGGFTGEKVENVFRELARLTGGAYGKFDAGAAKQLGELLRAVAAFAVGGLAALANQKTGSARLLLGQMKVRQTTD
jgi:hypothetical protein